MGLVIRQLTNQDREFYPLLGPFLARREVVRRVGGPLWDEDGKTWFVALRGAEVAGFGAVWVRGKQAIFCSDYVADPNEAGDLLAQLVSARLAWLNGSVKSAVVVAGSAERSVYERHGFQLVRDTKQFSKMVKELS